MGQFESIINYQSLNQSNERERETSEIAYEVRQNAHLDELELQLAVGGEVREGERRVLLTLHVPVLVRFIVK